jgi:hypothetical protein
MNDVKTAVKIAFDYFARIYPEAKQKFQDIRLEEVELSDDESTWLVTIGFSRPLPLDSFLKNAPKFLLGEHQYQRDYKVFRIDAQSSKVRSMKIRAVAGQTGRMNRPCC